MLREFQHIIPIHSFIALSNATLPTAQAQFKHCIADLEAGFRYNGLCLS